MEVKVITLSYLFAGFAVKVFGIFNPEFFTYEAALYGLCGSILYVFVLLTRAMIKIEANPEMAKPIGYATIGLYLLRIVTSTTAAFLAGGGVAMFLTNTFVNSEAGQFLVGMICGLFIEYIIKVEFFNAVWENRIEGKLTGKKDV